MPSKSSVAIARLVRTPLAKRMLEELQLAGHAERTREAYLRAVSQLAAQIRSAPDQITEEQLRQYLLLLRNEKEFAVGSLKVAFSGIQFFYRHVVKRDWETLQKLRVPKQRKLPAVLSRDEVQQLLVVMETPHHHSFFITLYTLGLRLQERLFLEVGDIDSQLTGLPAQPEPAAPPNCPKCGVAMTLVAILQRSVVLTALVPRPAIIDTS